MDDNQALEYLHKKVPEITWSIEYGKLVEDWTGKKNKHNMIRGSFMKDGEELFAFVPYSGMDIVLDDIAEAFKKDYERKK